MNFRLPINIYIYMHIGFYIYICAHVYIYICMYRFANKRMIGFKKTCQFLQEISVLPVVCIDFFMVTLK